MFRTLTVFFALVAISFFVFIAAIEHPNTRGPLRCWISESFYDLSALAPPPNTPIVGAVLATDRVRDMCDAADDPAIWVDTENPENTLILGTNKQSRINIYDLRGNLVGSTKEIGAPNNIDIRVVDKKIIAIASDKDDAQQEAFFLKPDSKSLVKLPGAPFSAKVEQEVYGLCLYSSGSSLFSFVTDKSGLIAQYKISNIRDRWESELVRELRVSTQPEGCVVDDENHQLFVGEEDVGIWRFDARPDTKDDGELIASTQPSGPLAADIEGLAILKLDKHQNGYLIASSQGDHSYVVLDRLPPHAFRGQFQLSVDGAVVGDTDGLDVTSLPVGREFPKGLLVVQDGLIRDQNGQRRNQGFVYASWAVIEASLIGAAKSPPSDQPKSL